MCPPGRSVDLFVGRALQSTYVWAMTLAGGLLGVVVVLLDAQQQQQKKIEGGGEGGGGGGGGARGEKRKAESIPVDDIMFLMPGFSSLSLLVLQLR